MYDVIIIGSGASGLMSAVLLSGSGKKVLVLEKNAREGKKLSLCGGGNCNIGPRERESEELWTRYDQYTVNTKTGGIRQEPVRGLKNLYYAYPPSLVRRLLSSNESITGKIRGLGIQLREEDGLLYPSDYDARSFSEELRTRAQKTGAEFRFGIEVTAIIPNPQSDGFSISITSNGGNGENKGDVASADSRFVILATGGFSYPTIGGNDSGNNLLSALGIQVKKGMPAMGPITVENYPFGESSGTVIKAGVTIISSLTGKVLTRPITGDLLFTHRNLSGPLILDICGALHECAIEKPRVVLDLAPDITRDELIESMIQFAREHHGKQAVNLLSSYFPRTLASLILGKAEIDAKALSATIPRAAMARAAALVKEYALTPILPSSRQDAMSWTGGCLSTEIDFSTMEAKKTPGLYILGDMVSFCRPCGGYSLWFCWTGALAAAIAIEEPRKISVFREPFR